MLINFVLFNYWAEFINTMMCISIARQRLGKHIPARVNARKNRTPIARQRISKHASLKIEVVFSLGSVQSGYKEVFGSIEESVGSEVSSF
jgi:hypothetical protein